MPNLIINLPLSHCPKLKMNQNKPRRFQFYFSGLLEACSNYFLEV